MMNTMPKIALGAWSWGAGAAGGDQVFGSHLFEEDLKPVFDAAGGSIGCTAEYGCGRCSCPYSQTHPCCRRMM